MAKGGALLRRWVQKAHQGSNPCSSATDRQCVMEDGILTGAFAARCKRVSPLMRLDSESLLLRYRQTILDGWPSG